MSNFFPGNSEVSIFDFLAIANENEPNSPAKESLEKISGNENESNSPSKKVLKKSAKIKVCQTPLKKLDMEVNRIVKYRLHRSIQKCAEVMNVQGTPRGAR